MPRVGGPGTWVSIGAFRMCLCEVRGMCDSDKLHDWFLFFLFFASVVRTVFVEKVLQRLFPRVPSGQGKREPQTLAVQSPPEKVTSEKVSRKHAQPLTGEVVCRCGWVSGTEVNLCHHLPWRMCLLGLGLLSVGLHRARSRWAGQASLSTQALPWPLWTPQPRPGQGAAFLGSFTRVL